MKEILAKLRQDYQADPLVQENFHPDPLKEFQLWFADALENETFEVNAMTLATSDGNGRITARIVLLKALDDVGFTFFTNYESRKARDLEQNSQAALVFYWPVLQRQVRVEGRAEKVSDEESDAYFVTRPRGAQIGAWTSQQSEPVANRQAIEEARAEVESRFPDEVPRPAHWGGYRLIPDCIEFWQGRPDRLHDRVQYCKQADGAWLRRRLMP